MKTKEELNALKEEIDIVNRKLSELTAEELKQVTGGCLFNEYCPNCGCKLIEVADDHSFSFWHVCPDCGYKEMH